MDLSGRKKGEHKVLQATTTLIQSLPRIHHIFRIGSLKLSKDEQKRGIKVFIHFDCLFEELPNGLNI